MSLPYRTIAAYQPIVFTICSAIARTTVTQTELPNCLYICPCDTASTIWID